MLKRLRTKVLHRMQLRESWVIFFVLGLTLLNFPFLQIFNTPVTISNIPLLFIYFFTGWAVSIFVVYLFTLAFGSNDTRTEETGKP